MRKCVSTVILVLLIALLMSLPAGAADKPGRQSKSICQHTAYRVFRGTCGRPQRGSQRSGGARARSPYLRAHAQTHGETG